MIFHLSRDIRSPYYQIIQSWQELGQAQREVAPPTYTISTAQESYLNTVNQLIDLTRRLVNDRAALEAPVGYRNVDAVGEVRMNKRDIYRFQLDSQAPKLNSGEFLRIQDNPELRGRVSDIDGEWITLKFDTAIDQGDLAEQGVLERSTSDRPFRLQQDAVERLRNGEAQNKQLLSILVSDRYQPFSTPP